MDTITPSPSEANWLKHFRAANLHIVELLLAANTSECVLADAYQTAEDIYANRNR